MERREREPNLETNTARSWFRRVAKNGFVLVVPLLIWNAVLWPRLRPAAGGPGEVPSWLEALEAVLRAMVFLLPLFLTFRAVGQARTLGAVLYLGGLLIYFVSWGPWLQGVELQSVVLLLGPYVTPLIVFAGIAVLSRSPRFLIAATAFVVVHVYGGLLKAGIL